MEGSIVEREWNIQCASCNIGNVHNVADVVGHIVF